MFRDQYEAELINIARTAARRSYARARSAVMAKYRNNPRYAHITLARCIALVNYGVATREEN